MTHVDMRSMRTTDPILDAAPLSTLDLVADELGDVDAGTISLLVDKRPGWSVVYSLALDGPTLAGWRRAARDETTPSGVDEFAWQRTICAAQATQLYRNGTRMVDEQGQAVNFRNESLWRFLKVPASSPSGAVEAVRKFYANDFAVGAAAEAIMAKAGFGKAATEDPTIGSSGS